MAIAAPNQDARALLALGAVYVGEADGGRIRWRRAKSIGMRPEDTLHEGTYLRVHPSPKRFPCCDAADWRARVLYEGSDFIVVNKPSGCPVMAHESNDWDTVAACCGRALGAGYLYIVHRQAPQCITPRTMPTQES